MRVNVNNQTTLMIVLLLAVFVLSACNKSSDAPAVPGECSAVPIVGKWIYNGNVLTIKDDCTGSSVACGYEFKYPKDIFSKTLTLVSFTKSSGEANCSKVGDKIIDIKLYYKGTTQEVLFINDGFGESYYARARE